MTTLKNVIDTRTGLTHSVAIIQEKKVKYFIPVEEPKKSTKKKKG